MMRCQQAVLGQKRGKNSKKGQKRAEIFRIFQSFSAPFSLLTDRDYDFTTLSDRFDRKIALVLQKRASARRSLLSDRKK